jgi:ubiquinone/menaquinone biosynthesis C-methylase UbiE
MASVMRGSARDAGRKAWQDPDDILKDIGLKPGDTFIDIGCGEGYFSIPAARIAGETGRVIALDISPFVIETLKERAEQAGLKNLDARVGNAERAVLCEACADVIFFGIVMHDFGSPEAVLSNARRMMKDTGKLVDLDFKKIEMPFGPPFHIRLTEEDATRLVEGAGFKVGSIKQIPPYSYLLEACPAR